MKNNAEAFALLLKKQQRYLALQHQAKADLAKDLPSLKSLDDKMNHLGIRLTRATLARETEKVKQIKKSMTQLESEKEALLGEQARLHNARYFCEDCQDTGLVDGEACHCLKQCLVELCIVKFNLNAKAQKETFDTFDPKCYSDAPQTGGKPSPRQNAENIKRNCESYCEIFDQVSKQFLFTGPTGTGKTFISNCVAIRLMQKGNTVAYYTASQLISWLQTQIFGKDKEAAAHALDPLLSCDLLIIDDMGVEFSSEYNQKLLYQVIDSRLNVEKDMIISTNLNPTEIKIYYDERLSSRIRGNFKIVPFYGEDIRLLSAEF